MKTPVENEIAKEFFLDFDNTTNVSNRLRPNAVFKKNHRSVSRYFSKWNSLGYIKEGTKIIEKTNKKGTSYTQRITVYILNMNFYFDYAKEKLSKKGFTAVEKEIIEYIFSFKENREVVFNFDNIIEGITAFLERIFLFRGSFEFEEILGLQYIKGFIVKHKIRYIKSKDIGNQFEEFWKYGIKYGADLRNKIRILSNFSDKKYEEILFGGIKKYHLLPFVIPNYSTKEEKEELLRRFSIILNEDRALKPWAGRFI